jgi:hypothetical protein
LTQTIGSSTAFITFITVFFYLRISLVALVISAATVPVAPCLTIRIPTPNIPVDKSENLKVTITIANTGDKTLESFNAPRGVLDTLPENSFNINAIGSHPSFNGTKVSYTSGHPHCIYLVRP